jgi:hypothetical protein
MPRVNARNQVNVIAFTVTFHQLRPHLFAGFSKDRFQCDQNFACKHRTAVFRGKD